MKKLLLLFGFLIVFATNVNAQYKTSSNYSYSSHSKSTYVNGYTKSDGTYVQGHYRTTSNSTNHDNYSTKGNYNPFTGRTGSTAKDYSSEAYNYGSGKTIYVGSKGGQYYINSTRNKTYVPKRSTSNIFGF